MPLFRRHEEVTLHNKTVYIGLAAGSESHIGHIYGLDTESRTVVYDTDTRYGASTPLVNNSTVVISSQGGVPSKSLIETYSLDGDLKWTVSPPDWTHVSPLLIGNGHVYVHWHAEDGYRLVAYETATGDTSWRGQINFEWQSFSTALIRDVLYLANHNQVIALNSHTGEKLWRHTREPQDTDDTSTSKIAASLESLCVSGAPAVGLSPDTGDVLWKSEDPLVTHAVVDDELVASRNGELLVFRDADSDESGYTQVFPRCPNCNVDLQSYDNPQHCPSCGSSLDET